MTTPILRVLTAPLLQLPNVPDSMPNWLCRKMISFILASQSKTLPLHIVFPLPTMVQVYVSTSPGQASPVTGKSALLAAEF